MINDEIMKKLLETIKKETIPALGCTELGAVAYAVSVANQYLNEKIENININVNKNIFKNGKLVLIPNTDKRGLDLAGALGAICGNPDDRLMILKNANKEYVNMAQKMIEEGKVHVDCLENVPAVYVEVFMKSKAKVVEVVLKDSHDHISMVKVNGEIVYEDIFTVDKNYASFLKDLSLKEIKEISETIPIEEMAFIEEGINMNKRAAEIGVSGKSGLQVGSALAKLQKEGKLNFSVPMKVRILTAAAADSRMGGGNCPIMTSAGSGNQGLGVILPITVVAEENNIEKDKLIRAVFFAHAVNKYVKFYTGKLSSLCGCAIASGVGASAGISWILGGNDEQIGGACNNMLANLTGMICDGAKESCALKLSTSAEEAVIAAYLANENVIVKPNVGIVGECVEETIKNVGILCENLSISLY